MWPQRNKNMLTNKVVIYALGKIEGINSLAETLGKGFDDEKYIESWNKTMKLLGVDMPLKELEKIYKEFAKKMDDIIKADEVKQKKYKKNTKDKIVNKK